MLVHNFIAQQKRIHEEYKVFIRSVLSKHYCVSFTDNVSVPKTLDYSVNPGFAKLVSSTDNSPEPGQWFGDSRSADCCQEVVVGESLNRLMYNFEEALFKLVGVVRRALDDSVYYLLDSKSDHSQV